MLPVFSTSDVLCLAVAEAFDLDLIDDLHAILNRPLEIRQADPQQLDTFLKRFYGETE